LALMTDVIVIGAGLNGLVAANYLAKAGRRVLVLERREIAGGQAATETLGDGFRVDVLHAGGQLRPDIVRELELSRYGYPATTSEPLISLAPDGRQLRLTADDSAETLASIGAMSKADAQNWPDFVAFMREATSFLDAAYRTPMPRLPHVSWSEGAAARPAWLQTARSRRAQHVPRHPRAADVGPGADGGVVRVGRRARRCRRGRRARRRRSGRCPPVPAIR
jgi:phytoene dehydrogenase-like protein